ncbi:hypothetical protein ROZALSC1DRAFT_30065 [Rozella allomycis CSF55]|uniref:Uncharacterized protein n=1 Tax=Rozella allomycis (strain CSF55) TaxID=988480 RepID=A0A4P9YHQ4_ROZAC|nr:hypothetical protein ROZALSC1DRAFT_30065 [Rozella allomycis CSF55]
MNFSYIIVFLLANISFMFSYKRKDYLRINSRLDVIVENAYRVLHGLSLEWVKSNNEYKLYDLFLKETDKETLANFEEYFNSINENLDTLIIWKANIGNEEPFKMPEIPPTPFYTIKDSSCIVVNVKAIKNSLDEIAILNASSLDRPEPEPYTWSASFIVIIIKLIFIGTIIVMNEFVEKKKGRSRLKRRCLILTPAIILSCICFFAWYFPVTSKRHDLNEKYNKLVTEKCEILAVQEERANEIISRLLQSTKILYNANDQFGAHFKDKLPELKLKAQNRKS